MDLEDKTPLIKVRNLKKRFKIKSNWLQAVNTLNFDIYKGETLGLVGESGCGKSTTGRCVLRFYEDNLTGEVFYNDKDIFKFSKSELKNLRKDMQLIFQDPYASLNGRMTIKNIIEEPLLIHNMYTKNKREEKINELLNLVGLKEEHKNRYPHEFSGGQRQRICIARALIIQPKFVVCDEPIASLDVSIQSQIVNLLKDLQYRFKYTYLFIAHDLSMVKYISDRILVMYLGNMIELADSIELNNNPKHPYTRALLSAVPIPDPEYKRSERIIEGEIPNPMNPPSGCVFRTRCNEVMDICSQRLPVWKEIDKKHFVACHLYN
jgi:peptide/nickel transport system ATP-binding protein/oligopeptide transport system ATP-binding protein